MTATAQNYVTSCDTLVAYTGEGADRRAIFAKNSDRPGVECQPLTALSALESSAQATVQCQYLEIPQVSRTLAVLGSRPWWLWGFEHGVNEAGVAIGNEAIYTHDPVPETGLLGMDLVRLALERGATAREAKDVITHLLERYGQGGVAVHGTDRRYHNSFIIADPSEAWVIETSRRHWVAKRTTRGAVIANLVTIEDDWDECSDGIEEHARDLGYWEEPATTRLNFRAAFEDVGARSWTEARYGVGCRLLAESTDFTVSGMMRYLRDHFEGGTINLRPPEGKPQYRSVCVHPGIAAGSTAASMVVELSKSDLPPEAWVSMATPCTGVFLPVRVGEPLPPVLENGGDRPTRDSAWWAMRELQYVADRDPELLTPLAQAAWHTLEAELMAEARGQRTDALNHVISRVMEQRDQLILHLTGVQLEREHASATA